MKTNRSARAVRKIQIVTICLGIAVIAALNFSVSRSLAAQFGQVRSGQTGGAAAPSLTLGEVMAAVR